MYQQIAKTVQKMAKENSPVLKQRAVEWRRGPTIVRLERPSRLWRARALGYKPKQGVIVVRIKLTRGGMRQKRPTSGRRSKHMGTLKIKGHFSSQDTAERRIGERYPNMSVIGSYPVYEDGKFIWFEVILADGHHPSVANSDSFAQRVVV